MLILRVKAPWVFNGRRSEKEPVISYSVVMRSWTTFWNKISYLLLSNLFCDDIVVAGRGVDRHMAFWRGKMLSECRQHFGYSK